ncbi:MAG: ABC transporter ATP-binding protein [Spirochaetales bacterium]|nr:ABC transporter ATP-binding protein [Spirochaetales bacterium]
MPGIEVRDLVKTYRIAEREAGLSGSVRGLFKRRYREIRALDGISLNIDKGELVGYIGPNGAGKSTTVKVLSGILVPDSGTCLVNGRVPWENRKEHVARIGTVFGQKTQLWWDLPVKESFDLLKEIYRVPDGEYRSTLGELSELFDLGEIYKTPVRQLSLGQRMRCDMAAALLHSPDTLFLDEPTIGLDAVAKLTLRELIQRINREKGVTVILTTHDMDDVEALCQRVLLIGHGKILRDGTVDDLRCGYEDGQSVELDEVIRRLYREEALR